MLALGRVYPAAEGGYPITSFMEIMLDAFTTRAGRLAEMEAAYMHSALSIIIIPLSIIRPLRLKIRPMAAAFLPVRIHSTACVS